MMKRVLMVLLSSFLAITSGRFIESKQNLENSKSRFQEEISQGINLGGEMSNNSDYQQINETLTRYFNYRNDQFFSQPNESNLELLVGSSIVSDSQKRHSALADMKGRMGVQYTEVCTTYTILSANYQKGNSRIVDLSLKETIEIYYQYPSSAMNDNMGYEVEHIICLELSKERDEAILLSDTYYEMVPDVCSSDYSYSESDGRSLVTRETDGRLDVDSALRTVYNPSAAVSYAEYWWNSNNPSYYTAYADCANFVSQCLVAGGISMVAGNYYSGWHADSGGGTGPWERVSLFDNFWQIYSINRCSVTANDSSTYGKCLLGNPIYWLNPSGSNPSGHLMLITSYNSSNVPCYCAHNTNAHDVPITLLSDSHNNLYTLDFAHRYDQYLHYSADNHKVKCSVCNDYYLEPHTWVVVRSETNNLGRSTLLRCAFCGLTKVVGDENYKAK